MYLPRCTSAFVSACVCKLHEPYTYLVSDVYCMYIQYMYLLYIVLLLFIFVNLIFSSKYLYMYMYMYTYVQ